LSASAIVVRIAVPSIVIVGFIILMNQAGGVPIPVIFLLAVALAGAFLTANTTFGRYLYAIGGNPDAARLSGINLKRYILAAFCLMGALAGLASILHTARVGSASPDAGTLMELDAIASCVIGGTSLMGGRGTVFGACAGRSDSREPRQRHVALERRELGPVRRQRRSAGGGGRL
jgi:D-xylose transport system permease protein